MIVIQGNNWKIEHVYIPINHMLHCKPTIEF